MNRRCFFWSAAAFGTSLAASTRSADETVYRFTAGEFDVRMTVEFFDRYSSKGFWFEDESGNNRFCLSAAGEANRGCLSRFSGAVAVARYRIQLHSGPPSSFAIREHVRTIDQDSRVTSRPPYELTIELQGGIASDIQAFGQEVTASSTAREPIAPPVDPWCLLRQDLYLNRQERPFLVVHWKHALSAIRLLDVIPGDQTRLIEEPDGARRRRR